MFKPSCDACSSSSLIGVTCLEREDLHDAGMDQVQHVDVFSSLLVCAVTVSITFAHQKNGFVNIAFQPIVLETCKEFGVEWGP